MKKLFASLLAATMIAGMSVSAFAYADKYLEDIDITADLTNKAVEVAEQVKKEKDDYSFGKTIYQGSFKEDESEANGKIMNISKTATIDGGKVYFPIVVNDEVYDEDDNSKVDNSANYVYATKASEVEDVKAKVKATIGGKYVEKEANIVRRDIQAKQKDQVDGKDVYKKAKVYCVEVKVMDFADTEEKEIEFDLTLYNKNKKQAELEDINFTFGWDAKDILVGKDYEDTLEDKGGKKVSKVFPDEFSKAPKFKEKDGDLTLYLKKDAKAYKLDEVNGTDVELITLEMNDADDDATFEVKASDQDDLFLGYSTDADKAIVVANPDAELHFLDFDANPTFDFMGDLKLTVEDPEKTNFCYELKDGKVTPIGKYNAEDECFEIRTRQLTSYVLSDKELVNAATAEEEKPADKPAEEKPADKVVPSGALA